jgi:hypothetical protein
MDRTVALDIESPLLEANKKCTTKASTLDGVIDRIRQVSGLRDENLVIEVFDPEFEEFVGTPSC